MTECKHVIAPERMAEGYRENDSGIARHPLLVTLHGLLACRSSPCWSIGMAILALMLVRLVVRHRSRRRRLQAIACWIGSRRSRITASTPWFS